MLRVTRSPARLLVRAAAAVASRQGGCARVSPRVHRVCEPFAYSKVSSSRGGRAPPASARAEWFSSSATIPPNDPVPTTVDNKPRPTAPAWPVQPGSRGYGIQNFATLRRKGAFFVDRTHCLPLLDNDEALVFVRPPRFGKTVLLSTMEHYYDLRFKAEFDYFFGDLAISRIGSRDQKLQNSFHVLRLTLPPDYPGGSDRELRRAEFKATFNAELCSQIRRVADRLSESASGSAKEALLQVVVPGNASTSLANLTFAVNDRLGRPLMVLVDEYDRAPMTALASGDFASGDAVDAHNDAVEVMRGFLGALKALPASYANRYFVTGISPVSMNGLSIFNTARHLTFEADFAGLMGFTEAEVRAALEHRAGVKPGSEEWDRALTVLRDYFNGYRFSGATESLYNPQQVLRFVEGYEGLDLARVLKDGEVEAHLDDIQDQNQDLSAGEMNMITRSPDHFRAVSEFARESGATVRDRVERDLDARAVSEQTTSYLYYLGRLTLAPGYASATRLAEFRVPNKSIQWRFVRRLLKPSGLEAVRNFVNQPSLERLELLMSNVRLPLMSERVGLREYDFQHAVAAALLYYSPVRPHVEHAPVGDGNTKKRMDVKIEMEDKVIILECKTEKAIELAEFPTKDSLVKHKKHLAAEVQLWDRYAKFYHEKYANLEVNQRKEVFAFAVTLFNNVELPIVSQVSNDPSSNTSASDVLPIV